MAQFLLTPPPVRGLFGLRVSAAQNRAESIRLVPAMMMNEARKIYLMTRAMHGDDVRAWCEWSGPDYIGRWWLWDGAMWDSITCRFGVKEFLGYAR